MEFSLLISSSHSVDDLTLSLRPFTKYSYAITSLLCLDLDFWTMSQQFTDSSWFDLAIADQEM